MNILEIKLSNTEIKSSFIALPFPGNTRTERKHIESAVRNQYCSITNVFMFFYVVGTDSLRFKSTEVFPKNKFLQFSAQAAEY